MYINTGTPAKMSVPYPKVALIPDWIEKSAKRAGMKMEDLMACITARDCPVFMSKADFDELIVLNADNSSARSYFLGVSDCMGLTYLSDDNRESNRRAAMDVLERLELNPVLYGGDSAGDNSFAVRTLQDHQFCVTLFQGKLPQITDRLKYQYTLIREIIAQLCGHYEYDYVASLPVFGIYFTGVGQS